MSAAAKEKEKGNTAFKAGQYPEAVGHYSAAIVADRTDPTLPLNRAAAYLKLGKNEDAERDCTTVLALPSGKTNVKAMFRRAQARLALGKVKEAETDLREALRLEPGNNAVKTELDKLPITSAPTPPKSILKSSKPYRRRVPITIVDGPSPTSTPGASSSQPLMNAASSRPIKSESAPAPQAVEPPKPQRDPFETRLVNGHKVGGGIFRKAKPPVVAQETPQPTTEPATPKEKVTEPNPSTTTFDISDQPTSKPLPSLFEFTRHWNSSTSDQEKWSIIQSIPPGSLPTLFRTSLEPALLVSILELFRVVVQNSTEPARALVLEYMKVFPTVPRFDFVVMFFNDAEKKLAREALAVEAGWKL